MIATRDISIPILLWSRQLKSIFSLHFQQQSQHVTIYFGSVQKMHDLQGSTAPISSAIADTPWHITAPTPNTPPPTTVHPRGTDLTMDRPPRRAKVKHDWNKRPGGRGPTASTASGGIPSVLPSRQNKPQKKKGQCRSVPAMIISYILSLPSNLSWHSIYPPHIRSRSICAWVIMPTLSYLVWLRLSECT